MHYGIEKGAIAPYMVAKTIAEVIGGLLFCSLFDPIMLCDEAPSVDINFAIYDKVYISVHYYLYYSCKTLMITDYDEIWC